MQITHVALWAVDLEKEVGFYEQYFQAQTSPVYNNPAKAYTSRFLSFPDGGKLEIAHRAMVQALKTDETVLRGGWSHVAFSVGSRDAVDTLTSRLRKDGFIVVDGPRQTGDGFYESAVLDPEGNRVEIVV